MNRNEEINQGLYEWDLETALIEKPFSRLDKIFLFIFALVALSYYFFKLITLIGGFYRDLFSGAIRFSFSLLYSSFDPMIDSGILLLFVAFIWLALQAFRKSIAYGMIITWLPGLIYMHSYLYFKNAKWPFAVHCLGVLLIYFG